MFFLASSCLIYSLPIPIVKYPLEILLFDWMSLLIISMLKFDDKAKKASTEKMVFLGLKFSPFLQKI